VLSILPVLPVAWFVGTRAGYALAVLVAAEWFVADHTLAGAHTNPLPLLFNSSMLAIFLGRAGDGVMRFPRERS
jgi:hypothetical protein